MAIAENKAREIGMACFNVSLSQLVFCQYSDKSNFSVTLAQLHLFQPQEILLPHTTSQSQLSTMLRERFGGVSRPLAPAGLLLLPLTCALQPRAMWRK